MDMKIMTGGALAGLALTGGLMSAVSAQTAAAQIGLTEAQVIEIALLEVPGEVQEIELETEDGIPVYEVEILVSGGTEMEVEIHADTGEVLEIETEDEDGDEDDH